MSYRITIKPSNHSFSASEGETILESALREGFVIAYGCRNGACGTCKGRVLEGEVDYGIYQEHALPDEEKRRGHALFCQARPRGDLVIECREISAVRDIPIKTLPCRVQKMERLAPDVMALRLRLPASDLLASGTGFAPIKAIIEHALFKGITRSITLYWGGRVRGDLYLNALAERWQRDHGIRYIPVLSEALPEDRWTGRTGFVHRAVMEDLPDLSAHQVYACGSPLMVEAAHKDFTTECRVPDEEFYSDSFTPAAPTA
ncbi:MAG: oxidoreductase FAD/NAD(P)-binding protein [Burkholderiales bacterium]|nr:oxidoreductase FAD/NAD(P)-binding protein [Burkholderiales bacterium]